MITKLRIYRKLDLGLQSSILSLAPGLLQPAVLPDGHHAEHGQEERAAAGQDVPGLRRDQEEQGGDRSGPQGGSLHPRSLHGGSSVGRQLGQHRGVQTEGVVSTDACHSRESCNSRQARNEKLV